MNYIWLLFTFFFIITSLYVSRKINYNNYKILKIFKNFFNVSKSGLFMSLGTKMGVGSIIGVVVSIVIGGAGSIFWIILFSIFSTSLIYYESILGTRYRNKIDGVNISGPYYYIKSGLNKTKLAIITTILLIICYSFLFQMIQSNTIYEIINYSTNINKIIIVISFILLIIPILFFNLKEVQNIMNKIVPVMCLLFMVLSLYAIIKNVNLIPNIIETILENAFKWKSILIGITIGMKRSIFMSEVLVGTTSISSGVSIETEEKEASAQTLGIYFTNIIITLLVSFLILIFLEKTNCNFISYNILLTDSFNFFFGSMGSYFLIIILILFAITTILSGYYIGIEFINVIFNRTVFMIIFKILMLFCLILGLFFKPLLLWKIVDIVMFILIFINLYSIIMIIKGEKNDRKRLG